MRRLTILASVAVFAVGLRAAAQQSTFAQVEGGLWEISGAPETTAPVRQCVADVMALAQFEHRDRNCSRSTVAKDAGSAVISYSCGGAGFGHSKIDVITPRSLRISTQGISNQLPFNYVLQARRIGDCSKNPSSTPH